MTSSNKDYYYYYLYLIRNHQLESLERFQRIPIIIYRKFSEIPIESH